MDFDKHLANIILNKVTQASQEHNLDEGELKNLIKPLVKAAYTDGVKVVADSMVVRLRQQIPEMIEQERGLRTNFEQRLYDSWKKPFDLFDATVILTREVGERFLKRYRENMVKEKDVLIESLLKSHLRACQTAAAISVLLKSGFARDALARQRTLHELAVVALLLQKHPDTSLAERFLRHEIIETCAAAEQYETSFARLRYEPPDPANLAYLRAERVRLCQQFGDDFKYHYGWAAEVIGVKKPKFEDLEKVAGLDHLRPFYKMASYGVHATAKGMVFDIGSVQNIAGGARGLLAGASNVWHGRPWT